MKLQSLRTFQSHTLKLLAPLALALFALTPAKAAPVSYSITDLGTLSGASSEAASLTNSGIVAGKAAKGNGMFQDMHACLWQSGKAADLATLGGKNSEATAVNSSSQAAGITQTGTGDQHAFLWDGETLTDLGTLGGDISMAYGINSQGQVCGTAYTTLHRGLSHAFLWQKDAKGNGVMKDLGTLGGINSTALALNDASQVTGFAYTKGGDYHAFVWKSGVMKDLGTLGGRYSLGHSLNSQGQIVGHSLTTTGEQHAFLMSGGKMTDLHPFSSAYSDAFSINTWGQVVGMAELPTGEYHAFGYANGTVYDLNTLIPADSGWVLQEAHGINDWGQIVGFGSINGLKHAFLMTPPALNGTAYAAITRGAFKYNGTTKLYSQQVTLKNNSPLAVPGPVSLVLDRLSTNATLLAPSGTTASLLPAGSPYVNATVSGSLLNPGQTATLTLQLRNSTSGPITYTPRVLVGAGAR